MIARAAKLYVALPTALARLALTVCLVLSVPSCTYLKYASVQAEYARIQNAEPGQLNVKHMIDRDTFFVHGRGIDGEGRYAGLPKVIAAFSNKYKANERVDTMHFQIAGSHFGLNLPAGNYELLILADIDRDGTFGSSEVVGTRSIELDISSAAEKVLGQIDVKLAEAMTIDWHLLIDVPDSGGRSDSLFFPSGTIRALDDPIFDASFSTLGMYDPASFLEQAPTMFYALEEDLSYKIPVVFVHGIAGSAREFETFVGQLDHSRYKPWFFHYPSGGDLDQLAELFYQIYFSGKVYQSGGMPMIIVAHSMGGLVVREAINRYQGKPNENQVHLFVSMATPFGGHAAAAVGEKHGLIVLPSWRDLNPDNAFIANLYRTPLPEFVHHELIYAYKNPDTFKLGENSDGVVALASQLHPRAQRQASGQFGFDNTHTDVLDSEEVAAHILTTMKVVKNRFPPSHLDLLDQGGYGVPLNEGYSPIVQYVIRSYGKYVTAMTRGDVTPIVPEQERFVAAVKGEVTARSEMEKGWLKFIAEYPEFNDD